MWFQPLVCIWMVYSVIFCELINAQTINCKLDSKMIKCGSDVKSDSSNVVLTFHIRQSSWVVFRPQKAISFGALLSNQSVFLASVDFVADCIHKYFMGSKNVKLYLLPFDGFYNIRFTDMVFNKLNFINVLELQVLFADGILLNGTFTHLTNLQSLTIYTNGLRSIQPSTFAHMKKLKYLSLVDAGLLHLDSRAFFGLKNLQVLDLTSNNISRLQSPLFDDLISLRELSVSYNLQYSNRLFCKCEKLSSIIHSSTSTVLNLTCGNFVAKSPRVIKVFKRYARNRVLALAKTCTKSNSGVFCSGFSPIMSTPSVTTTTKRSFSTAKTTTTVKFSPKTIKTAKPSPATQTIVATTKSTIEMTATTTTRKSSTKTNILSPSVNYTISLAYRPTAASYKDSSSKGLIVGVSCSALLICVGLSVVIALLIVPYCKLQQRNVKSEDDASIVWNCSFDEAQLLPVESADLCGSRDTIEERSIIMDSALDVSALIS